MHACCSPVNTWCAFLLTPFKPVHHLDLSSVAGVMDPVLSLCHRLPALPLMLPQVCSGHSLQFEQKALRHKSYRVSCSVPYRVLYMVANENSRRSALRMYVSDPRKRHALNERMNTSIRLCHTHLGDTCTSACSWCRGDDQCNSS